MHPSRITELLTPFLPTPLTKSQLANISTYIDILLRWNARINLTAIRDPDQIVSRHFGESLFAARHLFPNLDKDEKADPQPSDGRSPEVLPNDQRPTTSDLIDLGSGPGFPGIPIKIWSPNIKVTLIESNQKKATFLREIIRALTLTDIDVFPARAEAYPTQASVVTLRAVENFQSILPTAANLVAPRGRLALLIGASQIQTAQTLALAFHWQLSIPIPLSATRTFLIGVSSNRSST